VERKGAGVAEILWMAVSSERRRMGIGTRLLSAIEDELRVEGSKLLEVKTLAAEARYAPYDDTRRFYEGSGFLPVETMDPYPGWEPGNPCAIYVKPL
jgi:GNAT superfamily N-acetyltransferase